MARYIIDRFEGDVAVLEHEDRSFSDVPKANLPAGVKAGDCLICDNGTWSIDADETAARAARIAAKMDKLFH